MSDFATLTAAVCLECQDETAERGNVPIRVTLHSAHALGGKRTFQGTVLGAVCRRCGDITYDGPDAARFERLVALRLTELGISTGAEIRFLRKQAGLSLLRLALDLGVTAEALAEWEDGQGLPPAITCALVAQLVKTPLERLTREESAHGTRPIHLV